MFLDDLLICDERMCLRTKNGHIADLDEITTDEDLEDEDDEDE